MNFKKLFLITLVCFKSISYAYSADKTVFLDIDFVLNNSNFGKSIYLELEKINKKNIDNLNKIEKMLKEKKESIDKTKNISSKEKLQKDVTLFNKEVEKYRSEKNNILQDFKLKKKKELDNFLIKINPIIQEYMKNNSIDIVFEKNQIFMGNTNIDITNNIIELINQKFKDNG
jgi:outer membrane protein